VSTSAVTFEASFPYMDAGAVCQDNLRGVSDVVITNPVDIEKTGEYVVTYRARDAVGNWNDGTCKGSKRYLRTVHVVDTLKPIIALKYQNTHLAHAGHGNEHSTITTDSNGNHLRNPAGNHFRSALQQQADAEGGSTNFNFALVGENSQSIRPWTLATIGAAVGLVVLATARRKRPEGPTFSDVN
jgi:hypothetical protein